MATVFLDIEEAQEGDLPHICIKCGRKAVRLEERRFYHYPMIALFSPLFRLFMTRSMTCVLPLCANHAGGWNFGRGPGGWGVRPIRIDNDGITLAGVDEYFAEALEDHRDGRRKKAVAERGLDAPPRRRRSRDDEDEGETRPRKQTSGGTGWVVGLVLGLVVVPMLLCTGLIVFLASQPRPPRPAPPPWPPVDGPGPVVKADVKPEMVGLLAVAPDAGFPGAFPLPAFVAFSQPDLPRQLPDAEIDKVIADLHNQGPFTALNAAKKLATVAPSEHRRKEVEQALDALLQGRDERTHEAAANALAVWGTPESVAALIQMLNTDRFPFAHYAALDALAAIKDPRAAEAVAGQLADHWHRARARQAIEKMGPFAEKSVAPYLTDRDRLTRIEACNALAAIGTEQSLEPLQAAAKDTDRGVAQAAQDAITAIKTRK